MLLFILLFVFVCGKEAAIGVKKLNLGSIDLSSVIKQREILDNRLNLKLRFLKEKNQNGNFTDIIEKIEKRTLRLSELEDVLTRSLQIFQLIIQSKDIETLDSSMDTETNLIIDQFQKLVIKAKNDKIDVVESKKKEDKQQENSSKEEQKPELQKIVDGVLKDVKEKADDLESSMNNDKFKQGQKSKDSSIETVIKVKEGTSKESNHSTNPILVDSANNQYVLSKSGDITAYVEDIKLLQDFSLLLMTCFLAAIVVHLIRLPLFFGFLIAGIVLGPGGFILNHVQIETISKGLGVILIMFYLGLEFNIEKLYKVFGVSLFGSFLLLVITSGAFIIMGQQYNRGSQEMIAIGSSIFLSSTAVVLHFLEPCDIEKAYGRTIVGILVTQDILLGFLLALMPVLQNSSNMIIAKSFDLLSNFVCFTIACLIIRIPCIMMLRYLSSDSKRSVLLLLGTVAYCLVIVQVGNYFNQSMELSCFVAGAMVSSRKQLSEAMMHSALPLKELFSALFFASLGLHIYPTFVIDEGLLLLSLTLFAMMFKTFITALVMFLFFKHNFKDSILVGVGLCQISEFTFVLASIAKSGKIIGREAFYLLIGVTSLSMLISPFFWNLAINMIGTSDSNNKKIDGEAISSDEMLLPFTEKHIEHLE